ncbi:MAG: metallophosphoesterase family protein [Pseudomonadota bacterium]
MTLYAIGDIHGHLDKLDHALALIEADGGRDAEVIFVGDYVDRGPDSRAVIDRLIEGLGAGRNWTCLKGNHDRMMEWFFEEEEPRHDPQLLVGYHWLHERLGGLTTLASYGVEVPDRMRIGELHQIALPKVPQSHLEFLRGLSISAEREGLFFAHAGIRPGIRLSDQTEEDLIWIRQSFLQYKRAHPKLIVHGHTPAEANEHAGNRVNLDGGAAYGGALVPVAIEGTAFFNLTDRGRVPLRPRGSLF